MGLPTFAPGTRIRHYELVKELGRGGMGVVYEARDTKLGRRVAIKLLHRLSRDVADRFLIEARATARCTHENIVVIHEVDEYQGAPYMVLELIEGRSLREVRGSQPMESMRVVELILAVARALQRAHGLGIVHRDLKPENVLVTDAGQVKVLDFGIAKAFGENGEVIDLARSGVRVKQLQLTAEGAIVGTLPYMAPEQMGVAKVDHRSDLWALGIIAYELLAGRHPVEPLSNDALIGNLLSDEPMASARGIQGASPALAEIVDRCLAKKKSERIADASTLVSQLEALRVERRSGEVAPVHAIVTPPRPRRSRWIAVLASVLLVGGIATAVVVLRDRDEVIHDANPPAAAPIPGPGRVAAAVDAPAASPVDASAPKIAPADPAPSPVEKPKPAAKPKPKPNPATGSAKQPCSVYTDRVGC